MNYQWRWQVLLEQPYLSWVVNGLGCTLALTACALLIATPLGLTIGALTATPNKLVKGACTGFIELVRSVPLLVQMFLWFFVLPELVPHSVGNWLKADLPFPEFFSAAICLGVYTSCRVALQVTAGISAVPAPMVNATLALGMTRRQCMRYVQLPIGLRVAIPSLASELIALLKNSSIALTIGVLELTAQTRRVENYTFHAFEAFTAATIIYLGCSLLLLKITRRTESATRIHGLIR